MNRRPRIYYSDSQKALMWERWKQGWTLHEIGKLFDRPHTPMMINRLPGRNLVMFNAPWRYARAVRVLATLRE